MQLASRQLIARTALHGAGRRREQRRRLQTKRRAERCEIPRPLRQLGMTACAVTRRFRRLGNSIVPLNFGSSRSTPKFSA